MPNLAEALGSLQNLQLISLPSTNFIGAIPDSIGLLPSLLSLDVRYNNITALPAFSGILVCLRVQSVQTFDPMDAQICIMSFIQNLKLLLVR